MKTFAEIKEILSQYKPIVQENTNKEMGVFGSYVSEQNDVDVLKDFPSLLKFIELENYLSDTLGVKVEV